jgi:ATP-dependent DNA ligase
VFDVLAVDDDDLRSRPLGERRAVLEQVLAGARPPIRLCPATTAPTSPERGSVRRRARRSTA